MTKQGTETTAELKYKNDHMAFIVMKNITQKGGSVTVITSTMAYLNCHSDL